MEKTYEEYLGNIHKSDIDYHEIKKIFKDELSLKATKVSKIVAGEVNKVYEVQTGSKSYVIRISTKKDGFYIEDAVMRKCRKLGVPITDNLYIGKKKLSGKNYSVNIQNKVDGSTLERGSIDIFKISKKELGSILFNAGEILRKINSIQVEGFGYLNKNCIGESKSFYCSREYQFSKILN